jgi:hypothetical protein
LKGVGNQASKDINKKIRDTAMTSMSNLRDVLELVIDRFNEGTFAQEKPVSQGHETIFHVLAQGCNELDILSEQLVKERLRNLAFVTEEFAKEAFSQLGHGLWG